jgi:hypothetical protein
MMDKLRQVLIPLAALLLAACSGGGKPSPTLVLEREIPSAAIQTPTDTPQSPAEITPTLPESSQDANADVTHVRAVLEQDGTWTFHVTVAHPDTGWEDYVDGWDVVAPDGTVLKVNPEDPFTRLLLHPHVDEQPFNRSQRGITIPEEVTQVVVRAHDILAGFGGQEVLVDLEQDSGPGFEVVR